MRCKDRLHELVKDELDREVKEEASAAAEASRWDGAMKRIFRRMDNEVVARNNEEVVVANCRCELQSPNCDAVGSTAVVAVVTANKIIVANCGDSRAVLCRNGKAVPLSSDHKVCAPICQILNRLGLTSLNLSVFNSVCLFLIRFCKSDSRIGPTS